MQADRPHDFSAPLNRPLEPNVIDDAPYAESLAMPESAATRGAARELEAVVQRARDERFRMVRLVKDYEARLANLAMPVPADQVARLTDKIHGLDHAVSGRFDQLNELELQIDKRLDQLHQIQNALAGNLDDFNRQIAEAQGFKATVDAAKKHVRVSAASILEDIKAGLADFEQPIADKLQQLADLDEQLDTKLDSVGRAIDHHLAGQVSKAQQQTQAAIAAAIEPVDADLQALTQTHLDTIDKAIADRISALDVDVDTALSPLTQRFDAMLEEAQQRAGQLETHMQDRLAEMIDKALAERVDAVLAERLDAVQEPLTQQIDDQLQSRGAELQAQAERSLHEATRLESELQASFQSHAQRIAAAARESSEQQQQAIAAIDAAAADAMQRLEVQGRKLTDTAKQTLDRQADQITAVEMRAAEIDAAVTDALDKVRSAHETLAEQARAAAGHLAETLAADQEAEAKRGDNVLQAFRKRLDQQLVEALDAGTEQAQQRIEAIESTLDQRVAAAQAAAEDDLAEAQRRLEKLADEVKSTMRQHVVEAMSKADDMISPVRERLDDTLAGFGKQATEQLEGILVQLRDHLDEQAQAECQAAATRLREGFDQAAGQLEQHAHSVDAEVKQRIEAIEDAHADAVQRVRQRTSQLAASAVEQIEALGDELDNRVTRSQDAADDQLQGLRKQADELQASLHDQHQQIAGLIEQAKADAAAAVKPYEDTVGEHLEHFKEQVAASITRVRNQSHQAKRELESQAKPFDDWQAGLAELQAKTESVMAEAEQDAERRLGRLQEQVRTQASAAIDEAIQVAADRTRGLRAEALRHAEPVHDALEEQAQKFRTAASETIKFAEAEIGDRITDLRQSANAMLDLAEKQIDRQARSLRPKVQAQLDAAREAVQNVPTPAPSAAPAQTVATPGEPAAKAVVDRTQIGESIYTMAARVAGHPVTPPPPATPAAPAQSTPPAEDAGSSQAA
ncbi:MAG: hypothetical protein AAF750_15760 [Planctomycetota bacterium]